MTTDATRAPRTRPTAGRADAGHDRGDDRAARARAAQSPHERRWRALLRLLWRDYSLSIVVAGLFAASFLLHAVFGWLQYVADQRAAGAPATIWGSDGFVIYFGEWTFQNWQSEFLEVLVLIVLTSFLIHKGSHESKDSSDRMQAAIDRIERKLDRLERERSAVPAGDDG